MFNINEIFELAEQIERNGYAFYCRAAEIAEDEGAKKFLLDLADMENDHEKLFIEMKKRFTSGGVDSPFDADDIALSYLRSMVDGEIFSNLQPTADLLTGSESVAELKKLAIEFEKNTVVYFVALRNAVKDEKEKALIERLVDEEIQHIAILTGWDV